MKARLGLSIVRPVKCMVSRLDMKEVLGFYYVDCQCQLNPVDDAFNDGESCRRNRYESFVTTLCFSILLIVYFQKSEVRGGVQAQPAVSKDFFGRVVNRSEQKTKVSIFAHPIAFKFNEVRKMLMIS